MSGNQNEPKFIATATELSRESEIDLVAGSIAETFSMELMVSQILREHLADKNLSLVAREIGIRGSLLADWVAARRLPSLRNIKALCKIAEYLNMTLEELLCGRKHQRRTFYAGTFKDETREYRIHLERIK